MSHLILTYLPDNEFDGELRVSLNCKGYIGYGAAWFSAAQLSSFCAELSAFPLSRDKPASLHGGYWSDNGTVLHQTHVGITIAPYGPSGSLLVSVELSEPIREFDGHDLHRSVKSFFRADYASLDRFRAALLSVITSEIDTATLHGD